MVSAENGRPRWIALDGAANARAVVPGVLLRADNLQSLSAAAPHSYRLALKLRPSRVSGFTRSDTQAWRVSVDSGAIAGYSRGCAIALAHPPSWCSSHARAGDEGVRDAVSGQSPPIMVVMRGVRPRGS